MIGKMVLTLERQAPGKSGGAFERQHKQFTFRNFEF